MIGQKATKPVPISGWIRFLVTLFGVVTWVAGGVATFKVNNGPGSTTLILAGSFALMFAGAGRWPLKIVMGGNEIDMSHEVEERLEAKEEKHQQEIESIMEKVDENVKLATTTKSGPSEVVKNLESLQIEVAKTSGITAIRAYDLKIRRFLKIHFPTAEIRSKKLLGTRRVDFEVIFENDVSLLIETKFLSKSATRFLGKSLDLLIDEVPADARLLVIVNVENVEIAKDKLQSALGSKRSDVIGWRGVKDDKQLLRAIKRLTT